MSIHIHITIYMCIYMHILLYIYLCSFLISIDTHLTIYMCIESYIYIPYALFLCILFHNKNFFKKVKLKEKSKETDLPSFSQWM